MIIFITIFCFYDYYILYIDIILYIMMQSSQFIPAG